MANDLVTQIADAVVAELNAPQSPAVWSQTFTAERQPFCLTQPKDLAAYKVTVVAGAQQDTFFTRAENTYTCEVGIYIQCPADPTTNGPTDAAVALCGQISDYWYIRQPAAFPGPVCMKRDRRELYNVKQLHEDHVGTVPLVLTFEYCA